MIREQQEKQQQHQESLIPPSTAHATYGSHARLGTSKGTLQWTGGWALRMEMPGSLITQRTQAVISFVLQAMSVGWTAFAWSLKPIGEAKVCGISHNVCDATCVQVKTPGWLLYDRKVSHILKIVITCAFVVPSARSSAFMRTPVIACCTALQKRCALDWL
eukprot:1159990-Pelagomonas_calceolata.AAC.7